MDFISLSVSITAAVISLFALVYTRIRAQSATEALLLDVFSKALQELGTPEARDYRKIIQQLPNYISDDYSCEEGEEVPLWIRRGESIVPKPIRVKRLEGELVKAFGETAVRTDRIGFIFSTLGQSKKLKEKYINWLSVMLCDNWNMVAPHVALERRKRAKEFAGASPPSVCFVPYFEKLVYEAYKYYSKWMGKDAKIFCLNPKGEVDVESVLEN